MTYITLFSSTLALWCALSAGACVLVKLRAFGACFLGFALFFSACSAYFIVTSTL